MGNHRWIPLQSIKIFAWFKILVIRSTIIFLFFLLISACDTNTDKLTAISSEEETIAIVNNQKIFLSEFQKRYQKFIAQYPDLPMNRKKNVRRIKKYVIDLMIQEALFEQEAARRGIQVSEEELNSKTSLALQPYPGSKFEIKLKNVNLTKEEWREEYRKHLLYSKLIQQEVNNKIPITRREIQVYYKENKKKLFVPRRHKVRHISVSTLNEAQGILAKLKKRVSFEKLARNNSISPDKSIDGDMGYVSKYELPIELEKAVFKLRNINQLSPIIQSEYGFHIFKLEVVQKRKYLKLKAAKSKIKKILISQKQDQSYHIWLKKLESKASKHIINKILYSDEGF